MVETQLIWLGYVDRRHVCSLVKRGDLMKNSQITRGRRKPRKTIKVSIKKDREINGLNRDMIYIIEY